MENVVEYRMGDRVVFDWVFDEPQEVGVVVDVDNGYVEVEYVGYKGRVYRDRFHVDSVDLESNWC